MILVKGYSSAIGQHEDGIAEKGQQRQTQHEAGQSKPLRAQQFCHGLECSSLGMRIDGLQDCSSVALETVIVIKSAEQFCSCFQLIAVQEVYRNQAPFHFKQGRTVSDDRRGEVL